MTGISHALNIAKQALLTHQLAMQVTAHNVANVNTPGFSRQSVSVEARQSVNIGTGILGGGVLVGTITRNYDQFMLERISHQSSLLGNLQAQQQSLRVAEPIFNEARGLALNDLMNQFWNSWQDLSASPETMASRQSLLQHGHMLVDHLGTMNSEIIRARSDIGVSINSAIDDVNSLTKQIAALNAQISAAETAKAQANDLRDSRDNLVKELSQLLDVSHFAGGDRGYTVLLANGHPLVADQKSWQVDWVNEQLRWVNIDVGGQKMSSPLKTGVNLGGKIGGWLATHGELTAGNPTNYAGRLDALANAMIRELNQVHSRGVGTVRFSGQLVGGDPAVPTAVTTGRVDPLTAAQTIPAGTITINGLSIGEIRGGGPIHGRATTKAAHTTMAINQAEAGVKARLTTQVAGASVDAASLAGGVRISFTVNRVRVDYIVQAPDLVNNSTFAASLVTAINAALVTHNANPANIPKVTIEAMRGDGGNGGALDSLILRNTNAGDESSITIDNLNLAPSILGLGSIVGQTIRANSQHNTGEITLFAGQPYTFAAGVNDNTLAQLGLHTVDLASPGDGRFTVVPTAADSPLVLGYQHGRHLNNENGSFDIWLYNDNGSLALAQPVTVSLKRVYSLNDAVRAINQAIVNAGGTADGTTPWVQATFSDNRIHLTPTANHQFAFADDSSNFLQIAGLNTFFTGHSAGTIGINQTVGQNLEHLAAGRVQANGQIFSGDNTNALAISGLQHKNDISFVGGQSGSFNDFYNSLVSDIGNRSRTISRSVEFNTLMSNQINEMRDSISGVSLDEEMVNLIKLQHAFTAAARLIAKSDEMMVTLLNTLR